MASLEGLKLEDFKGPSWARVYSVYVNCTGLYVRVIQVNTGRFYHTEDSAILYILETGRKEVNTGRFCHKEDSANLYILETGREEVNTGRSSTW
jgi:hypothetical protein